MEPEQPPSTPSTHPSDPLHSLQPASTDRRPFQGTQSDERLRDRPAPSQGTSMWPRTFQGNYLPDTSLQSSMHHVLRGNTLSGNQATPTFNIPSISHSNAFNELLNLDASTQQFRSGNAFPASGTVEYSYDGQSQTIYPPPATGISFLDWQQSTSLPQNSLSPHQQSQVWNELALLDSFYHTSTASGPPPEAAATGLRHGSVDQSGLQVINLPPSAARGIELASPRPADGETTVQVRRDTLVILSLDTQILSSGSATYDGLKIPSTPSVNRKGSEAGKKLLFLQVRVLGATTKALYETLCHKCKDRAGDKDAFPDYRAKSNILSPQKNGRVLVAFILACCSKHREPQDSEYCLQVVLNGGPQQNIPVIQIELPYSFNIVSKLPPRARHQAGDADSEDTGVRPLPKLPRTDSARVENAASQSTGPSGLGTLSSGDSRGQIHSTPSGTSENLVPFVDNRHTTSHVEPLLPSPQSRQTVNTAGVEETADWRDLVIDRANPSRGPTTGGPEIWISGSNFPTGLTSLYVRFGDNFARAVVQNPYTLSCFLPPANVPGRVSVALSRSPIPSAPGLGTSLCHFEYVTDLNEMLPVIIRIQEDCTPEVAAGLDIFHKEIKRRNLKRNEKRPLRGEDSQHDEIETALIQALAPLQNTSDFGELISKTNDYKQTLAHFAVLFGYTNLLKRLVGWNIDITIADVNGFTALHSAYKRGDRVCVDLLLEKGASGTVLDALGRAPSHLMPEGFASPSDHDTDIASDGQPKLGQKRDAPSLFQSTDNAHGSSDPGDEVSVLHTDLDDLIEQIEQEFGQTETESQHASDPPSISDDSDNEHSGNPGLSGSLPGVSSTRSNLMWSIEPDMAPQPQDSNFHIGTIQTLSTNHGTIPTISSHAVAQQYQSDSTDVHFQTSNPSQTYSRAPRLFSPASYTDPAGLADTMQQSRAPNAAINAQSNSPPSGIWVVDGRNGTPAQPPTTLGTSFGAQSPRAQCQIPANPTDADYDALDGPSSSGAPTLPLSCGGLALNLGGEIASGDLDQSSQSIRPPPVGGSRSRPKPVLILAITGGSAAVGGIGANDPDAIDETGATDGITIRPHNPDAIETDAADGVDGTIRPRNPQPTTSLSSGETDWTEAETYLEDVERLGDGTGGEVFKVRDRRTNKILARKIIQARSTPPRQLVRELNALSTAKNRNLIRVYGVYISPSSSEVKVVMELCEGQSLEAISERIKRLGNRASEKVVGKIGEGIFHGLAYLHSKRIIHRDIKPSNILLSRAGVVKLCDFGLSGELVDSFASTWIGTSLYMAPERIAGGLYTIRSDVWSSGLTLLTFAQGRFPYPDDLDGIIELASFLHRTDPPKLMDEDPREDGTGGVRWSPAMKDFIALCLTKDGHSRPTPSKCLQQLWIVESSKRKVNMPQWIRDVWGWDNSRGPTR